MTNVYQSLSMRNQLQNNTHVGQHSCYICSFMYYVTQQNLFDLSVNVILSLKILSVHLCTKTSHHHGQAKHLSKMVCAHWSEGTSNTHWEQGRVHSKASMVFSKRTSRMGVMSRHYLCRTLDQFGIPMFTKLVVKWQSVYLINPMSCIQCNIWEIVLQGL